uniref:hypothetical protein n=1 Tax=Nocardioides sp. TaxID=35761 RepID=UPI002B265F50
RLLDTDAQLRRQLSTVTPTGPALDPALANLRGAAARVVVRRATVQTAAAESPRASVGRRATLARLSDAVVADVATPLVRETRATSAEVLSDLVASAATDFALAGTVADAVAAALATTTGLTPFLRWDPVSPPVVVPRRRFTEGESQRVLVIRSGVRQDPDSLEITVSTPASYADEVTAGDAALGYHAECQRHLVPPKTTQMTAELHGMLDAAVGTSSSAAKQKMLTWSLAEEGSLLDVERPDLDVPGGRLPQDGVSLAANDLTVVPASLPLAPGEAPPTGQYVVHDTDRVTTPYLPDPLAAGISLVFPEAVEGIGLTGHDATEGFTTEYGGTWPKVQPIRLDLVGRQVLDAERKARTLTVGLPAGDLQRFRLSSSLRAEDLDLLAVWRKLPSPLTADPAVAEAAKDGWLWSLTPYDDVLLVHAVPRPVQAPRVHLDTVVRRPGRTEAALIAELRVHGSSTQSVNAEATWTEHLDDLAVPTQPQHRPTAAIGFTVPVDEHDATLALRLDDEPLGALMEHLPARRALHHFPDTKHRRVTYTFRATTRFREYFHPSLIAADPAVPGDDGLSVISAPLEVSIPSSARPAAPVVHSVIPLFRWASGTESEQPMGWRHERSTGVRIYLERPWFSSGEGELLAVLLASGGDDDFGYDREDPAGDQSGYPFVSKVGADPIWDAPVVENRAVVDLQLASMLVREHADGVVRPGRPVEVRSGLRLPASGDALGPLVTAAAYRPQFNAARGLWYVDVAIDPWAHVAGAKPGDRSQEAFWPFVRLAVARYQPESIAGHHLSAPVRCRYVQLPPTRTTSVDRTDERSVRVVVSGTIGNLGPERIPGFDPHRVVVATLSRRDPDVPTDLGWTTVASSPLTLKGRVGAWDVAWVGELTSPDSFRLRRPSPSGGGTPGWRVTVEEWERFEGDPPLAGNPASGPSIWEQRLVYADEFLL